MNNHKRRLKTIELTLTPEQIVLLWHEAAKEAGTFSDGAWKPPAPRAAVANAVNSAIRKSMKGHPEPVVEKAIQQARKQADLLLMIIVQTNSGVLNHCNVSRACYQLAARHLRAVVEGPKKAERLEELRLSLLAIIEPVLIDEGVVTEITIARLNGQEVLFRDASAALRERAQWARALADIFNSLAPQVAAAEIDLDEVRAGLRSEIDGQVSRWVDLARLEMLVAFGEWEEGCEFGRRFVAAWPGPEWGSLPAKNGPEIITK